MCCDEVPIRLDPFYESDCGIGIIDKKVQINIEVLQLSNVSTIRQHISYKEIIIQP